jgi:hypothetical protein
MESGAGAGGADAQDRRRVAVGTVSKPARGSVSVSKGTNINMGFC